MKAFECFGSLHVFGRHATEDACGSLTPIRVSHGCVKVHSRRDFEVRSSQGRADGRGEGRWAWAGKLRSLGFHPLCGSDGLAGGGAVLRTGSEVESEVGLDALAVWARGGGTAQAGLCWPGAGLVTSWQSSRSVVGRGREPW